MKPVNLLPSHYTVTRTQNTRRRQITGLAIAAGCICIAWTGVLIIQLHHIGKQMTTSQSQLQPLQNQWADIEATRLKCDSFSQKVMTLKQLRDPIALDAVLAKLSQLFPDEAVLQSLVIEVPVVSLPETKLSDSPQARKKIARRNESRSQNSQSTIKSTNHLNMQNNVMSGESQALVIQLQGLVSSDVIVAQLARELSESGLFRNVRIEDAKPFILNKQQFHQFRLSIEIPVYHRPTTQLAQGPVSQ